MTDNSIDRRWPSWLPSWLTPRRVCGILICLVAAAAAGAVTGVYVIDSDATGSPNDAIACSYFWQFEADPGFPALVHAALANNPGTNSGSHFLGEWLNTLWQQVDSQQTLASRQTYSDEGTAVAINSICQQLGFNPPGS